jgi:hypothetical protein
VAVEDAGGNIVTTDTSSVTLSITANTGTSGASLTCTTNPLAAASGVATFSGCKIDKAGTNYQLHAIDGTLTAADSASFTVSNVAATSVIEATGPAPTVTTASISPVSGATYLVFVYCSGQSAACNGTSARATVSSPAFTSVTFDEGVATGTSKDCLEVLTATGTSTSGVVTVTGASGQNIGFVNVVQLSAGATVKNGLSFPAGQGASSPATAALTSPPSTLGELVPVAVADGNGQTTISVQTPASGMNLLGAAQQNATVQADMSVYFDSTAQSSASFVLNPTVPLNGWATFAIEVG